MRYVLTAAILLCISLTSARADDGVFYANGNTLIPVHETTISLTKEILKLKEDKGHLKVDVYFEFFNPGKPRKEIIGFVTPPGGYSNEDPTMPSITHFSVTVNDSNLKYHLSRFEKTGFRVPTKDPLWARKYDFVFYFTAQFHTGLNTIHHTYRIRAGSGQPTDEEYEYRLTTGKLWANSEMEDFTLSIDMGEGAYFDLPNSFWKSGAPIPWEAQGEGAIYPAFRWGQGRDDTTSIRLVKMRSGVVTCHLMHFRPDVDLSYDVPRIYVMGWSPYWNKHGVGSAFSDSLIHDWGSEGDMCYSYLDSDSFREFSIRNLTLLQDLPFAFHDCVFKSKELNEFFSQYNWYLPLPGRSPDMKLLDQYEQGFIRRVQEELRRRNRIPK